MHRVANLPGEEPNENLAFIEQPEAPVLFLTSAQSDISTLSYVLEKENEHELSSEIRALNIALLRNNAQIDHYLSNTAKRTKIIIVRFLGGRSDWSYGFQQLSTWAQSHNRKLIILSGTSEQEIELNSISNISFELTTKIGKLLKIGGIDNMRIFLKTIKILLNGDNVDINNIYVNKIDDPLKWNWESCNGYKVGVIFYTSILNSGNIEFAYDILKEIKKKGLNPRSLWVSSLKTESIQLKVQKIFEKENISCILTTTSFSSLKNESNKGDGLIWDILGIPVFQLLLSNRSKESWTKSTRGLDPIDLSLQVVLPELDGRITTKIAAFKSHYKSDKNISTSIYKFKSDKTNIKWIINLVESWIILQNLKPEDVKASIILSNYPIKDGRIANGVGLDTPASLLSILKDLSNSGYDIGKTGIPVYSKEIMQLILKGRTNSEETKNNPPLDYLSLEQYNFYWNSINKEARNKVESFWGKPKDAYDIEQEGFAIHGIRLGNIAILIQPSRGYTEDNISDIHSQTLPPTHRYLAQYFWIHKIFNSNVIMHLGKHGTAEWLPGKSVGLSNSCFPQTIIPPLPYLYPFIVNDPGEGSQAKRRTHAVIIDHLTPPLGRAGLTKELSQLESLLDEYNESLLLDSHRSSILKNKIDKLISENNLINFITNEEFRNRNTEIDSSYNLIDAYLCELKETQIRCGLHIFGKLPSIEKLEELILSIALVPTLNNKGLTQSLAKYLDLDIDPWSDTESEELSLNDITIMKGLVDISFNIKGDLISWLNNQAQYIVSYHLRDYLHKESEIKIIDSLVHFIRIPNKNDTINKLRKIIIPRTVESSSRETNSLLQSFKGRRISSGASGSPTRGKIEVLPTGKNFYSIDLRCVPTEAAWDLGRRSAEQILELYLLDNGTNLKSLALSVWATSTMRNGGEDICQLLALIGVKPLWDYTTHKIIGLEIIPSNILCRPRVDVTLRISGLFRDAFPHLVELVNKAYSLIANLEEEDELNPYASLKKKGESLSRVFGSAPESYGTGLQELINLGTWEDKKDLANCYLEASQWHYKDSKEPAKERSNLENILKTVQVVLHSQDNREHDLLDSDDYYQFHGGLSTAVKELSGSAPKIYFGDNSRFSRPRVHKLSREIDKVMRSRLLNPKWIEAMKEHGYKGAFEMSASLDYLFAYDATTEAVDDWCYSALLSTWLCDKSTSGFLLRENPWVLRDMSERLLEAYNRNMWAAKEHEIEKIKSLIIESEKDIEQNNYL
ncbi:MULTISPECIES: cobaltochelatase subunit CobN [unclassified Prochlorococcus]|uniref:cobaltochelatase subunit CobN n=1 Tax=unclassified Prochlorococcus TaxID=2627481 RepID=UPI0005338D84|nr:MULTISPECIES: cobaltochelatase subunit CobN [unclassified Prochlorococcus]KGG15280.1 CobN component of cobalt chelatase involved in B12 biosynthesis [Prochlorococcus sp. MIT 0602]KGG17557.1 CobN component of cobalt chelatase involved in B12 biosynthesis [Prochlorococcus sp. MIT 0603]